MATKTTTKTNRNAKAATKATTTKATKKNATVAKPAATESKQAEKKMSQIEAAVAVLAKTKEPINCITMVEAMQVAGLWASPGGATALQGKRIGGTVFGYDRQLYYDAGKQVQRISFRQKFRKPATWRSELVPQATNILRWKRCDGCSKRSITVNRLAMSCVV